jgi:protein transport protein SEC24
MEGSLPAAFSNMEISRAPPLHGAPRGLTPKLVPAAQAGNGPPQPFAAGPPSAIRGPPAARHFPGSPQAPQPHQPSFVRAMTESSSLPLGGRPAAAFSQLPPFGVPPGAVSQQRPPFGGPVSPPPPPFGVPLGLGASQAPPPFVGHATMVSQALPFGGGPEAASHQPPFGGPSAAGAQPAPPFFGVQRPAFSGPPTTTAAAVTPSQEMPLNFGAPQPLARSFVGQPQYDGPRLVSQPPFAAQSPSMSHQGPFMGPPRGNAPAFGPPSWQSQVIKALSRILCLDLLKRYLYEDRWHVEWLKPSIQVAFLVWNG